MQVSTSRNRPVTVGVKSSDGSQDIEDDRQPDGNGVSLIINRSIRANRRRVRERGDIARDVTDSNFARVVSYTINLPDALTLDGADVRGGASPVCLQSHVIC